MSSPPRAQRLKNLAPTIISMLMMVALAASLAWQSAELLRMVRSPILQAPSQTTSPHEQHEQSPIAHLFGTPKQAEGDLLPSTNLRLTLLGSFVHSDPAQSSAILQQEGQPVQRYGVNAELAPGVRLAQVHADHVEVLRNGRRERLDFPQRPLLASVPVDPVEQLDQLEADNIEALRVRMEALREQMEANGQPGPDREEMQVDPANQSSAESE